MGGLSGLFRSPKRRILEGALDAVDLVKVGLYNYILPVCEQTFDQEYAGPLAAGVVNTIFSEVPSNKIGREFLNDESNAPNIRFIIERSIVPREDLRRIITDAVRVKGTASFGLSSNASKVDQARVSLSLIGTIRDLGLLIPGGEAPDLKEFKDLAQDFAIRRKRDLDNYRARNE